MTATITTHLAVLGVALTLAAGVGYTTGAIAARKGHSRGRWAAAGFLFWPFILAAVLMHDRAATPRESRPPVTVGQAVSEMTVATATTLFGALLAVLGSIGPWVTSPLLSVGGLDRDGIITIIAAGLLLAVTLVAREALLVQAILAIIITAVAVYDLIDIHNHLHSATLFGVQVVQIGWGVYVVAAGGAVALMGLSKSIAHG